MALAEYAEVKVPETAEDPRLDASELDVRLAIASIHVEEGRMAGAASAVLGGGESGDGVRGAEAVVVGVRRCGEGDSGLQGGVRQARSVERGSL